MIIYLFIALALADDCAITYLSEGKYEFYTLAVTYNAIIIENNNKLEIMTNIRPPWPFRVIMTNCQINLKDYNELDKWYLLELNHECLEKIKNYLIKLEFRRLLLGIEIKAETLKYGIKSAFAHKKISECKVP